MFIEIPEYLTLFEFYLNGSESRSLKRQINLISNVTTFSKVKRNRLPKSLFDKLQCAVRNYHMKT